MAFRPAAAAPAIAVLLVLAALDGCSSFHIGAALSCPGKPELAESSGRINASPGQLTVLSWNLHGIPSSGPVRQRLERIGRVTRRHRPDLALFQEVWFDGDREILSRALAPDYLALDDSPDIRSPLWPLLRFRRGGLASFVLRRSRWSPDRSSSSFVRFEQAAPLWRLAEGDGLAGKGYQIFAVHDGFRTVVIVNTHLQARYRASGHFYDEVRQAQLRQLSLAVEDRRRAASVLVAGDFNLTAQTIAKLAASGPLSRWQDLTRSYRDRCRCGTHLSAQGREAAWIDYVFAAPRRGQQLGNGPVRLIRNAAVDCPYSDHHGLEVEVRFLDDGSRGGVP